MMAPDRRVLALHVLLLLKGCFKGVQNFQFCVFKYSTLYIIVTWLVCVLSFKGIAHLDSEDPLGDTLDIASPPHPSKLIHRHIRGKSDVSKTYNRESQELNHQNHDARSVSLCINVSMLYE